MIKPSLLYVTHQDRVVMNNFSLSSMVCIHQQLARGSRYLENMYFPTKLSHITNGEGVAPSSSTAMGWMGC